MSIGGPLWRGEDRTNCLGSAMHRALCYLSAQGVLLVAAAGNNGASVAGFWPSGYKEVGGSGGANGGFACSLGLGWTCQDPDPGAGLLR